MIWKILKSSHFKLLIKCFQAIVIKLQREKFFKVALLSYKKMALLALFKTNHTGPSSTGSLGLHQISADIGSPVCSLPKSWDINKPNLFPQITLRKHNNINNFNSDFLLDLNFWNWNLEFWWTRQFISELKELSTAPLHSQKIWCQPGNQYHRRSLLVRNSNLELKGQN